MLPFALGACALPIGVQVASLVVDGVSYIATDKSLSDHGLSYVAERDCAIWRVMKGDKICRDIAADPIIIVDAKPGAEAAVEQLANFDVAAGGPSAATPYIAFAAPQINKQIITPAITTEKFQNNSPSSPGNRNSVVVADTKDDDERSSPSLVAGLGVDLPSAPIVAPPTDQDGLFYIIASFRNAAGAERYAASKPKLKTAILPGTAHGRRAYRVAVGPVVKGQRNQTRQRLRRAGFKDAWALKIGNKRLITELAALE